MKTLANSSFEEFWESLGYKTYQFSLETYENMQEDCKSAFEAGQRSVRESAYNEGRASRDEEADKLFDTINQLMTDIEADACGKCWQREKIAKQTALRCAEIAKKGQYREGSEGYNGACRDIANAIKEEFKV